MGRRLIGFLVILLSLAATGVEAETRDRDWKSGRPTHEKGRPGLTLDEAVEQARRETGGRILSFETEDRNGRPGYRIKILTPDGRVRIIRKAPNR